MDPLKELAKALGLSADAPKEKIFKAAGEMVLAGKASKEQLAAIEKQLGERKLKLDQGKILDLEPSTSPSNEPSATDSPEVADLKKRLAANEIETAKSRLSAAQAMAADYVKKKIIPPAMQGKLQQLLSQAGQAQALSLSGDGQQLVKTAFDSVGTLREILDAVPAFVAQGLSTLSTVSPEEAKKKEEALSHAKDVARRATGKKKPAASGADK